MPARPSHNPRGFRLEALFALSLREPRPCSPYLMLVNSRYPCLAFRWGHVRFERVGALRELEVGA
eukprot:1218923-Rhodomonas_salina.1